MKYDAEKREMVYDPPVKGHLSNISLIEVFSLGNNHKLRVENDDWGKYLRVINEDDATVFSKLIIDEINLNKYIDEIKQRFN